MTEWTGPDDAPISPTDARRIYEEELLTDDDHAMVLLQSVWSGTIERASLP